MDERLARRRDPARRLRRPRLARRPADRRRPGDGRGRIAGAAWARRCSACASGSASPARRSGVPAVELADLSVDAEAVLGPGATERVADGGLPALLELVRARLRPVDPLDRAAALAMARPETRVAELGDDARRERAPAAAAVPRRGRLRARRRSPGCCASSASCSLSRRRRRRPRAARPRRGLRRPGASHARGAAALRADARRARRLRRGAGGRTRPFRSSGRRAGRVPSGGMIDRAEAYIWKTARVLEQRRFEVLFKDGDPRGGEGRAGALQDRGRRLRLRAGARRARADEPAAAHLDRAGGARGHRRDRPARAGPPRDDHRARRRRARGHAGHARLAGRAVVGDRRPKARCSPPRCCSRRSPSTSRTRGWAGRRRSCGTRWTRSTRRTRTRSRRRSRSSTPRPTARAREAAAERLGGLVREQDLVGTQPEGYTVGEIHHPHDFATHADSLARRVVHRRGARRVARPPRVPPGRGRRLGHHLGRLDPRDRDRVERAGDDRSAQDAAIVRARLSRRRGSSPPGRYSQLRRARRASLSPRRAPGPRRGRRSSRGSRRCRRGPRGCRSASSAWSRPPRRAGRASSGGT